MGNRKLRRLLVALLLAVAGVVPAVLLTTAPAHAFTTQTCHDDTSIARTNSHGSPLNGTFGTPGQAPNHSNSYYYLDIKSDSTLCPAGSDGHVHLLGRVTANGVDLATGHPSCSTSAWFPSTSGVDNPPCDPKWRGVTGAALANESPTWAFEIKDGSSGAIVACTGGNGSGGTDCPGTPNITASPGNATVEFRFDNALPNHPYRFRIANEYDTTIWETATFDVVACSTCEP